LFSEHKKNVTDPAGFLVEWRGGAGKLAVGVRVSGAGRETPSAPARGSAIAIP